MASLNGLLGSVVWTGIGVIVAWNGWASYSGQRGRVENAKEVQAEITDIDVSTQRRAIEENEGGAGATRAEYVPQVTFEYTFDGEQYTASNITPPSKGVDAAYRYPTESGAREHFAYDISEAATAYVDPARPAEGFLEAETNTVRNLAIVALGSVMILLGVVFAAVSVVVL
jgi:hypothetical protein